MRSASSSSPIAVRIAPARPGRAEPLVGAGAASARSPSPPSVGAQGDRGRGGSRRRSTRSARSARRVPGRRAQPTRRGSVGEAGGDCAGVARPGASPSRARSASASAVGAAGSAGGSTVDGNPGCRHGDRPSVGPSDRGVGVLSRIRRSRLPSAGAGRAARPLDRPTSALAIVVGAVVPGRVAVIVKMIVSKVVVVAVLLALARRSCGSSGAPGRRLRRQRPPQLSVGEASRRHHVHVLRSRRDVTGRRRRSADDSTPPTSGAGNRGVWFGCWARSGRRPRDRRPPRQWRAARRSRWSLDAPGGGRPCGPRGHLAAHRDHRHVDVLGDPTARCARGRPSSPTSAAPSARRGVGCAGQPLPPGVADQPAHEPLGGVRRARRRRPSVARRRVPGHQGSHGSGVS